MGTSCVFVTVHKELEVNSLISWGSTYGKLKLCYEAQVQQCDTHVYFCSCQCLQLAHSCTSCQEIKCISSIYSATCHKEVVLMWFSGTKEAAVTSSVIKLSHLACISDLMLYKKDNYPKKTPFLSQHHGATMALRLLANMPFMEIWQGHGPMTSSSSGSAWTW